MNKNEYFMPYSIVLTNEGLNYDGTNNLILTSNGFTVHKFPQQITLPKFCKLKWVNLTINEIPSEKELYLCIKELPNKVFLGDGVNGRLQNGFLGLVNHLDTTSNVFSNFPYIYLKNTEPINLSQMTLEIYTNDGLASSFSSDIIFYNLNEGNVWTSSTNNNQYNLVQSTTNKLHWEGINANTGYRGFFLYFDKDNPTHFTTNFGLTGYYDIDNITPSADVGKIVYSNGATWTSSLNPTTTIVSTTDLKAKYALELRVEQENINI